MEYTGCGNAEHRGLKVEYCPVCHLGLITLKKGVGEHVLQCYGSFKSLAKPPNPGFEQKSSAAS